MDTLAVGIISHTIQSVVPPQYSSYVSLGMGALFLASEVIGASKSRFNGLFHAIGGGLKSLLTKKQ